MLKCCISLQLMLLATKGDKFSQYYEAKQGVLLEVFIITLQFGYSIFIFKTSEKLG